MTTLNPSTIRRLKNLPQISGVWEGDRRSLMLPQNDAGTDDDDHGDCILWVDGQNAVVRAMDVVTPDVGLEAIVRTLLRAFEHPHGGGEPMRPSKIVVRDREIQFFLRGVLQELEISVEHVSELPFINEIFHGLQASLEARHLAADQPYQDALDEAAYVLWNDAPWHILDEEKIIAIHLNRPDVETFYVSTLGMLGVEYGVLMYRSVHSLKQFRQRVLTANNSAEALEEAFLQQDCLFLTFEQASEYDLVTSGLEMGLLDLDDDLNPTFGNLHPLEGMRPYLYEEEAISALIALEAIHRLIRQHSKRLMNESFPAISSKYRIPDPSNPEKKLSIHVETLPDLASDLATMTDTSLSAKGNELLESTPSFILHDDLVPQNSFYSLGVLPWDVLELMRPSVKVYQPADGEFPTQADGFPIILIQTSRPKALTMIEELQASGGLKTICFNSGEDPLAQESYDLGLLQTNNGEFHLFGEFGEMDPVHVKARQKWDQRCKKTKGYCGLVIAMGVKGASRGNPKLKDMMGLFEVQSLSSQELGLQPLQRFPSFDLRF
ncbi:MAG: hypothetical protein AAGA75_25035 [Cyanobacteria bacterium P01_E01_bin.6]